MQKITSIDVNIFRKRQNKSNVASTLQNNIFKCLMQITFANSWLRSLRNRHVRSLKRQTWLRQSSSSESRSALTKASKMVESAQWQGKVKTLLSWWKPLCVCIVNRLKTLSRQELSSLARDSVVLTMSDVRNWGPLTLCECEHRHSKHCRKLSTSLEKGARKVLGLSATTKVKCLLGFFVPRCEAWTKPGAADSRTAIVTARWSTLIRNLDRALRGPQGSLCCLS